MASRPRCPFPCSGLIPRLLGDILSLWLCNMLAYLINTYALENGVRALRPARRGQGRLGGRHGDGGRGLGTIRVAAQGLKEPFLLLQVSTMAEMKSYSQAVTGVSAACAGGTRSGLGGGG